MCFVWGSLGGGIQGLMHIAYLYKSCSICKSCKICEFELYISNQNGFKSTSFTTVSSFQMASGRQGDKQVHSIIQTAVALSMKLTQMRHATFYRFSMYNTEMCHHWCINSREWWNANFWRSILRILTIYTFNFPGTIVTSCLPFPRAPDGLLSQTVNLFTK